MKIKHNIPHVIPYQGSKRNLARRICALIPHNINTLYEPFAGSAAITIYAAYHNIAKHYVIADSLEPLTNLWQLIINQPEKVASRYSEIWEGYQTHPDYFLQIRERFNHHKDPIDLLYLIARCVKNSVRFNRHGQFTQSADKRRLGTHPNKMQVSIYAVSHILKGKTEVRHGDFIETTNDISVNDFIYMDPPYHGTTYGQDKRYFAQLHIEKLISGIEGINAKKTPFILSYDGKTGDTEYLQDFPKNLQMKHLWIDAGRSSQATLSGRNENTMESIYISKQLSDNAYNWCAKSGLENNSETYSLFVS